MTDSSASGAAPAPREEPRWLCSHLVHLVFEDERYPEATALLEEISPGSAELGVESSYPTGVRLQITAEGFAAPAVVESCQARETDFWLGVRFEQGFRWEPSFWEPEHLLRLPRSPSKRNDPERS